MGWHGHHPEPKNTCGAAAVEHHWHERPGRAREEDERGVEGSTPLLSHGAVAGAKNYILIRIVGTRVVAALHAFVNVGGRSGGGNTFDLFAVKVEVHELGACH